MRIAGRPGVRDAGCDNSRRGPKPKRKIQAGPSRLSVAVLLAVASLHSSPPRPSRKSPPPIISASPGHSYEMTGEVVPGGSIQHNGPEGIGSS